MSSRRAGLTMCAERVALPKHWSVSDSTLPKRWSVSDSLTETSAFDRTRVIVSLAASGPDPPFADAEVPSCGADTLPSSPRH